MNEPVSLLISFEQTGTLMSSLYGKDRVLKFLSAVSNVQIIPLFTLSKGLLWMLTFLEAMDAIYQHMLWSRTRNTGKWHLSEILWLLDLLCMLSDKPFKRYSNHEIDKTIVMRVYRIIFRLTRQVRVGMTSLQQAQGLRGKRGSPYDRMIVIVIAIAIVIIPADRYTIMVVRLVSEWFAPMYLRLNHNQMQTIEWSQ
jgi:hypothetical protein